MAPLTRGRANNNANKPTKLMAEYYKQRASAGLIISEGSQVSSMGVGYANTPGIHTNDHIDGWKLITKAVHEEGGKIFIQIWHVGRISHPYYLNGNQPIAPSAININQTVRTPEGEKSSVTPKEMTMSDIKEVIHEFSKAASNAVEAGFDGVWASGLEISASYGLPDANILTMSEYLERATEMNEATSLPVIADCDTGYGNVNNVIHMVEKYEKAGIAAICIEDKLFPKVNSFIEGRQDLADIEEFCGKIRAVKNTQKNPDFMVIARVEALIAGWGMKEALKRATAYAESGADAILIHSKKRDNKEILEFCKKFKKKNTNCCSTHNLPKI